jgi:surfactin synthase thioesterase subunit
MFSNKLLFVLHYAGGSAYNMAGLKEYIGEEMEICFLELPGRGKRIKEELLTNLDSVIEDLYSKIKPMLLECSEYSFFGHSMGALLSYLLLHKLQEKNERLPQCLFVSGARGPSIKIEQNQSLLSSVELKLKLKEYGGSSDEILNDANLMEFFEPIIRADFKLIESYMYQAKDQISIPIVGFFGTDEKTTREEIELWQLETIFKIQIFELPGNHFFIFENWSKISEILKDVLLAKV